MSRNYTICVNGIFFIISYNTDFIEFKAVLYPNMYYNVTYYI